MKKFLTLLTTVLFFGCSSVSAGPYVQKPPVEGEVIPQFDNLWGSDDQYHNLSDFAGEPLLLMFETGECPYCEQERPHIKALEKKYAGAFNIVTIAVGEPKDHILQHVEEFDIDHLWLSEGQQLIATTYIAHGTPDHFFVDEDQVLVYRKRGYMSYEELEEALLLIIDNE